jgi:HEAT repeat protein
MRQLILLSLFVCFAAGCGKKQPPPPTDARIGTDAPTEEPTAVTRANLFTDLKGSNQKTKREAAEELSAWVESDPESVTELLNLLKDKSTTGAGKILPNQINSTREAAALTLLWSGPKGEAILKDKGLAILRAGLIDPQPAIREHTIYTIGLLGPLARPLSAEVMQLCTSADANIRGRAFDTLALIGVTDVAGFAHLLNHANGEVGKDAARLVPTFPDISSAAIAPLTLALESTDLSIRVAAAVGLARAGPTAAPAAMALQEALKKSYPAEYNPNEPYQPGAELVFWEALRQIGEAAVVPTTDLLTHTNPIVRAYAAKTLGEIGPASRSATEKLKAALKDTTLLNVPIEAACALCAIGAGKDEAIEVLKRAIDTPSAPAQFAAAAQFAIETIPRLGEAGKPLYPLALSKLTSDNPFARFAAVGLVATLPTAEGATYAIALGKLATDPLPDIRNRVALVLEKLGPTAAPAGEALGKAFSVETVEPIRDHVLDALIALGPGAKPALPLLLPLVREATLSTPARRLRVIGAIAVADPSSKDVLAALLTAVNDDDATTRAAVATALGKLDPLPPEALAKLVALANSDKGSNPQAHVPSPPKHKLKQLRRDRNPAWPCGPKWRWQRWMGSWRRRLPQSGPPWWTKLPSHVPRPRRHCCSLALWRAICPSSPGFSKIPHRTPGKRQPAVLARWVRKRKRRCRNSCHF